MTEVRAYGPDAVLVEHPEPLRLWRAVHGRPGVQDAVPAEASVLVRGPGARRAVEQALAGLLPPATAGGALVHLPVRYDGPDLDAFPGRTAEEVVALHAATTFTVAFLGFAPGFPYCTGLPAALRVPRLDSPRPAVPAGSVAVAGRWCGVYPTASPGGWRLLGRTEAVLFDPDRDPPALLAPGDRLRCVPV